MKRKSARACRHTALLPARFFSLSRASPKRFDMSGKSPAYIQHHKSKPAPGNRWRAFLSVALRQRREPACCGASRHCEALLFGLSKISCRALKNVLRRRANHWHMFIIARILEPAPRNRPRVFSIRLLESDGGTQYATPHPPYALLHSVAGELPSEPLCLHDLDVCMISGGRLSLSRGKAAPHFALTRPFESGSSPIGRHARTCMARGVA
jgi:hypothetical protein